MAEENAQERTEAATPKRRDDARKKGQVARSRELSTSALLMVSASVFFGFADNIYQSIAGFLYTGLHLSSAVMTDPQDLLRHFATMCETAAELVVPFFIMLLMAVIAAGLVVGGWVFSTQSLVPDFSRMDPISGLQKMVSKHGALELVKAILKAVVVGGIGMTLLWAQRNALFGLVRESPEQAMLHLMHMSGLVFLVLAASTLLIVLFDVPFQIWTINVKLKMSRQDQKDEMKEMDGNPEIKAKVRAMQREMARRRMMAAVPKADVIVTNPTHYAVALRYAEGETRAPVLLAKGADLVAASIRELAAEHYIPVVEAPPLARALYHHVELDQEIPVTLYRAVAELLAYLYQLRLATPQQQPQVPAHWSVPPEMDEKG
ncbi:flagellar biosynthesis protein FlhB [Acidithiobacillus sp.]|jgi:flagellar biosynthetic protein FlhB|uniref:flagellar biosynthesis protein FlhB n=1 Tax=Acidithiobacillus sp. TaxID=1872118 RepID=UPI0025C03D29|nr:flagellar biosynthesis protein FlhB [Acidithiobacillus sp.]MCK9187616.1 flagellar type III secretion system protein FlhB [Acidithiobacillus sp.]MCK9358506.1 flagellar type III secretion system protein FlhB [Acidithiobacillus sp.]